MSGIKRYLFQVKYLLPCSRATKKEILQCLKDNMEDLLDDNIHVSFSQLCQQFGTPKECAFSFINEIAAMERKQFLRRRVLASVIFGFITILLTVVICVILVKLKSNVIVEGGPVIIQ